MLDSDIDLLILTRNAEFIKKTAEKFIAKKIQFIFKTPAEFSAFKEKDPYFFTEIDRGIVLYESYDREL